MGGAVVGVAIEQDVPEGMGQGLLEDTDAGGRPRQRRGEIAGDALEAGGAVFGAMKSSSCPMRSGVYRVTAPSAVA